MGKIIIDRDNNYLGVLAGYNIFLNNSKIDSINNGEVKEYKLENGEYSLYIQNGLISFGTKSNVINFTIKDNTEIRIACDSTMVKMSGIKLNIVYNSDDNIHIQTDMEKYQEIGKLKELRGKNIITEEEFNNEKQKLLKGE